MNSKLTLSFKSVFIILFVLEAAFFLWQFLTHRISAGHDTTQYFIIQYYFLNHLICHGEVPQWMPYMTQGTVATWWFSIQADLFQNALMIFHPFLKTFNFATLFTVGIFGNTLFYCVAFGCGGESISKIRGHSYSFVHPFWARPFG
jgi:hypothetical protein